jgi:succinate dehydrogenase flavin-adding protein (antitoxin of CptAB toxin-antitoxin module)
MHPLDTIYQDTLTTPEQLDGLERLLICDDMFIMRCVAGRKEVPKELDTEAFRMMKTFAVTWQQGGGKKE